MNDETTIIQVLNRVMYIIFENLLKFTFIRYTLYCGVVRSEYGKRWWDVNGEYIYKCIDIDIDSARETRKYSLNYCVLQKQNDIWLIESNA